MMTGTKVTWKGSPATVVAVASERIKISIVAPPMTMWVHPKSVAPAPVSHADSFGPGALSLYGIL
jgi:hypothetical protein